MGISSFPTTYDGGVLPLIVMNGVLTMTVLKNMLRSLVRVLGGARFEDRIPEEVWEQVAAPSSTRDHRRVSVTKFGSLCRRTENSVSGLSECCCVCLCGFESEEEVSELSCKHFFHRNCLEKWFDNNRHTSCPLCRSIE